MRVWIDVDNPPQVQYLLPFRAAFEAAGVGTVVTARDYGSTLALLADAGVEAHVFGARVGRGKVRKLAALVGRAHALARFFAGESAPDAMLGASRPGAVAARRLGIPSFIVGDYEYANVSVYRLTGSTILYPDAIDPETFTERGLRKDQLLEFRGLKEDISFAGIDLDAVAPHDLGVPASLVRVLFRPPSETSHYYSGESSTMATAALRRLAEGGAVVVFAPRERGQVAYLEGLEWAHEPVVLDRPVPFVSLLKSVDAVVCSGGTMLREAAYLGIPAYSIFQSRIGGVDLRLEELGRATLVRTEDELGLIELRKRGPLVPLESNPNLLDELVEAVVERVSGAPAPALVPYPAAS